MPKSSRGSANSFGNRIDNAVRFSPGSQGERVRTDISCTLFLAGPDEYDGGDLVVEPVTRGARLASFFWVELRGDEQRRLLYDMDLHLTHLRETVGETDSAVIGLTGTYHNLLRLWADV